MHHIRITITEIFSALEDVHHCVIAKTQQKLVKAFHDSMPTLVHENFQLSDIINVVDKVGDCPEMADALKDFAGLEIPFYNTVYPVLRKEVFDEIAIIQFEYDLAVVKNDTDRAKMLIHQLQNTAIKWTASIETLLCRQGMVFEILAAALERLQDRIFRNDTADNEWLCFVQYYWTDIQDNKDSYSAAMREKIEAVLQ